MSGKYTHPSTTHAISIDPNAPGTPMRIALVIEAALNILSATYFLLYPYSAVQYLASTYKIITPLSESFFRLIAIFVYSITFPILFSIPNTRRGIETRIPTYLFLAYSEALLVATFAYLGFLKKEQDTGMSTNALVFLIGMISSPIAWRVYVLKVKPEWIGRYAGAGKQD